MPELRSPEISGQSGTVKDGKTPAVAKTADEINDMFNEIEDSDDEPEKQPKRKDKEPEVGDADDKDKDEIELIEDDNEEKLDLSKDDEDIEINAPPRKREILKEYPDVFKKFPFLEKMLYRDKEYTELFGSFDDAKEIAERAETFSNFEQQLLSGKTEEILKNIKETDSKAFDKIIDNYLPVLAKVDKEAYFEVVGNMGKQLIAEMVKAANEDGNDELKQAALMVNQFMFNTSKYTPAKPRVTAEESKTDEAEQERLAYVKERFDGAVDDLQGRVDNILRSTINEYIDRKGTMTAYVKKNAVNDSLKYLHEYINGDTSLRKNLDKLWKVAFDAKFSKDSLARIQSLYLGRAKSLLPNSIKKARAEALKDLAPRKEEKEEKEEIEEQTPRRRGPISAGRPSQQNSKANTRQKGESVAEFFARE